MNPPAVLRVSVVMPAYDEGARLPPLLAAIAERLRTVGEASVDVVVVDDGSGADDAARMQAAVTAAAATLQRQGGAHAIRLVRAPRNGGKGSAIRPLLPLLREDGWMLDVEVLALLKARGARIVELPIDWADAGRSKVRFGIDALRMLWALGRIRARARPSVGRGKP